MSPRSRRFAVQALLLALAFTAASCASPKITRFDAAPQRICQDQSTTLAWSVKGDPVLTADPPLPGTGAVAAEGSRTFAPAVTTVFTLRVSRGDKEKFARQEVVVFDTAAEIPIVIATEPGPGGGLLAATTAPAADWDASLQIALVTNASDRPLTARHGGREVVLAVGETSDAFAALAMSGEWELAAGLLPGEVMGDPEHAPADRLRLRVALACGE